MKRLFYSLVSLLLLSTMLLAACAAPSAPGPAPTTAPAPAPSPTPEPAPAGGMTAAERQLYEAAKKEGELLIWTNTWEHGVLEKIFMNKYPGIKVSAWDAPTGAAAIARLMEEQKAGVKSADVFFTTTQDMPLLMEAGLAKPYDWPNAVGMSPQPAHKLYFIHTATARAPIYNNKLVTAAEAPKKWEDLMSARWRGKSMLSTSGEGATLLFAYMWRDGDKLGWDRATQFWKDVRTATQPRIERGFTTPRVALVAGEYDIFLLASLGGTIRLIRQGAPVTIAPIGDAPASTWSLAILKYAAHPAAAQLFADFFSLPENMAVFADMMGETSMSSEARKLSRTGKEYAAMGLRVVPIPAEIETDANSTKSVQLWQEITRLR
ncbi:MAG: extracellular solute-binding protein [Dehalococcoidia bacterium]|nr:extracellular solute-binding protein [Dehalococcoidia bacterium]